MKVSNMKQFRAAIALTCAAIGKPDLEINIVGNKLCIPDYEIEISSTLNNNKRYWRAMQTFSILSPTTEGISQVSNIIFEEPFGSEILMAQSIGMFIAQELIEEALDNA